MKNPEKKKTTAEKRPANVFDGVLTRIGPTRLVMKGKNGEESSMKLHEKIKASCDGVACECEALKPGQKIRVFAQKTDLTIATKIASLSKNSRFAPVVA